MNWDLGNMPIAAAYFFLIAAGGLVAIGLAWLVEWW